jgi:hypothetical protein
MRERVGESGREREESERERDMGTRVRAIPSEKLGMS